MRVTIVVGWYAGLEGTLVERERDHYHAYGDVLVDIPGLGVLAMPSHYVVKSR